MTHLAFILALLGISTPNWFTIFEILTVIITALLIYKKKYTVAQELLIGILVIVFVYTPATKLMKYEEYVLSMKAQPLVPALQTFLIYAVPFTEFLAVLLMAIPKYRIWGLYVSLGMLTTFTGYISLIQLNYYGRIPCSCGGIIREMSWGQHLVFNLYLMVVTLTAIWMGRKSSDKGSSEKGFKYLAG